MTGNDDRRSAGEGGRPEGDRRARYVRSLSLCALGAGSDRRARRPMISSSPLSVMRRRRAHVTGAQAVRIRSWAAQTQSTPLGARRTRIQDNSHCTAHLPLRARHRAQPARMPRRARSEGNPNRGALEGRVGERPNGPTRWGLGARVDASQRLQLSVPRGGGGRRGCRAGLRPKKPGGRARTTAHGQGETGLSRQHRCPGLSRRRVAPPPPTPLCLELPAPRHAGPLKPPLCMQPMFIHWH